VTLWTCGREPTANPISFSFTVAALKLVCSTACSANPQLLLSRLPLVLQKGYLLPNDLPARLVIFHVWYPLMI
jgi:hypothetical protein